MAIFDILINEHLNNYNHNKNKRKSPHQQHPQQCKSVRIDFVPELDVIETKESFIIETELPGVNKEDIQIEINDSKLYIQGEKKRSTFIDNNNSTVKQLTESKTNDQPSIEEFEDKVKSTDSADTTTTTTNTNNDNKESTTSKDQVKRYISERSYGSFKRYLDLNKVLYTLDLSTIKTQLNSGLLTITINKKQDFTKTIKITL